MYKLSKAGGLYGLWSVWQKLLGFLSDAIWNGTLSLVRVSIGLLFTKLWRKNIDLPFAPSPPLPFSRNLTKPRRGQQRERQKTIGLMSKTTILHVHHAFLYISLPALQNYDVKWPNFKFTWERERQGDKFYYLCPNWSAFPSLQLQPKSPSFK